MAFNVIKKRLWHRCCSANFVIFLEQVFYGTPLNGSFCLLVFHVSLCSSRPEVFYAKGVLKNLIKLSQKKLCVSLFFNKVKGLRLPALLKKRLQQRCSPVNFVKFSRRALLIEHLRWLLSVSLNSQKKAHDEFLKKGLCSKRFPKNFKNFFETAILKELSWYPDSMVEFFTKMRAVNYFCQRDLW